MNKKLTKIKQVSALVILTIFAQIAAGLPVANAAIFSQSYYYRAKNEATSDDGSILTPVIPYLSADFQLPDYKQKIVSKLIIIQGNFLAAYNSPKESRASDNSKGLDVKIKELIIPLTAYSSTPDQTDATPFITARGTYVRDGIVAANFLPFGTKIKIPELFGDKIFVVEDRMNRRHGQKVDIWFPTRLEALEFGIKTAKIQIIES